MCSRQCVAALEAAVITVGKVNGGYAGNVICGSFVHRAAVSECSCADKLEMVGTIRALDEKVRELLWKRIHDVCAGQFVEELGFKAVVQAFPSRIV